MNGIIDENIKFNITDLEIMNNTKVFFTPVKKHTDHVESNKIINHNSQIVGDYTPRKYRFNSMVKRPNGLGVSRGIGMKLF